MTDTSSQSTVGAFRESLLATRQRLTDTREKIRGQHEAGSPGIQVCACLTDLVDTVVLELYEAVLADLYPENAEELRSQIALVPLGGFGRRDVAPYSDVDLMILHAPGSESLVAPLAKRMLRDVFDVGLELAQSLRTPSQACQMALEDATICTSLIEARYLTGSVKLFSSFAQKFQRRTQNHFNSVFAAVEAARRDERAEYGETVYLLEPNVKRSRGGLRDIQLLRWVGFARYGVADPESLQLLGGLSKEDQSTIRRATEFLLRLRNELHFHAEKAKDVLDRSEQLRIAELYGFQGTDGILPVEQFMGEYFRHTKAVRSVASEFVASNRPGSRVARLIGAVLSHQVEGDYRVGPREITATRHGLTKLGGDLNEVLRLMDIANLYDKRIAQATWNAVRAAVPGYTDEVTAETSQRFLSLLSQPARLGELLHRLHELGVLEKIIPAFRHARCLLQFNEYHKYTVDEHCIVAVERAIALADDPGPIGRVYRKIKRKRTLHLALLIHDLGKGFVEDHSEVGLRIADDTAKLLRLPVREAEALKFLVHKHLMMAHLAFRRDTSDDQVVVRFAVEVGSPEMLDMLLVLTAADIAAVGPGVWNDWKGEVLADLYYRTMRHLAGDSPASDWSERRRAAVRAALAREPRSDLEWYDLQIDALPSAYLDGSKPEKIAAELKNLRTLPTRRHSCRRTLPGGKPHRRVRRRHERDGRARRVPQIDRGAGQSGSADPVGRNQHAGRRIGARPVLRRRSRLLRPAAARADRGRQARAGCIASLAAGRLAGVPQGLAERTDQPAIVQPAPDPRPHRQQHVGSVHDSGYLRPRPDGFALHHRPYAVRDGDFRIAGQDRDVPRSGGRRVLCDGPIRPKDRGRGPAARNQRQAAGGDCVAEAVNGGRCAGR